MVKQLHNDFLTVSIAEKGAELQSLKDRSSGFEFIWQADPAVWPRHSPLLFPIVGSVKNDRLLVNGQAYPLSRHGFARDQAFQVVHAASDTLHLELQSTDHTLAVYPFPFRLTVSYQLHRNNLASTWRVENTGTGLLPFSIGAHPAFNLTGGMDQYRLRFATDKALERRLLKDGLFSGISEKLGVQDGLLDLSATLFDQDAIVISEPTLQSITLEHKTTPHRVSVDFPGFPHLGIWAPKGCERFLCIEPWHGHADPAAGHADIFRKPGMIHLNPGDAFETKYTLRFIPGVLE